MKLIEMKRLVESRFLALEVNHELDERENWSWKWVKREKEQIALEGHLEL